MTFFISPGVIVLHCVVTLLFGFFCGCRGFCHMTESDLFLFLLYFIVEVSF